MQGFSTHDFPDEIFPVEKSCLKLGLYFLWIEKRVKLSYFCGTGCRSALVTQLWLSLTFSLTDVKGKCHLFFLWHLTNVWHLPPNINKCQNVDILKTNKSIDNCQLPNPTPSLLFFKTASLPFFGGILSILNFRMLAIFLLPIFSFFFDFPAWLWSCLRLWRIWDDALLTALFVLSKPIQYCLQLAS